MFLHLPFNIWLPLVLSGLGVWGCSLKRCRISDVKYRGWCFISFHCNFLFFILDWQDRIFLCISRGSGTHFVNQASLDFRFPRLCLPRAKIEVVCYSAWLPPFIFWYRVSHWAVKLNNSAKLVGQGALLFCLYSLSTQGVACTGAITHNFSIERCASNLSLCFLGRYEAVFPAPVFMFLRQSHEF